MIDSICGLLIHILKLDHDIIPTEQEAVRYGMYSLLSGILDTAGLLIIGFLFRQAVPSAIIIAVYYSCQTVGGGFHASRHCFCFIIMSSGLILSLLILPFISKGRFLVCMLNGISVLVLWFYPVVLHPQRKHMKKHMQRITLYSRILTGLVFLLFLADIVLFSGIKSEPLAVGTAMSALSRVAGLVRHDRNLAV